MKDRIDAALAHQLKRWIAVVSARPRAFSWAAVALTVLLGVYAGLTLGINSDNVRMISDRLPAKIAHKEFSRFFPNLDDALLIVVDGENPELTRDATETLAASLAARTDDFTDVYIPGGGSYFERNGLLYRSVDELDQFADQMARLQPVLAQLERDPSISALAGIVRMGLDAVHASDTGDGADGQWSMILDRVGNATVTIFDEFPIAVSWEDVLLRGSSIDVTQRSVIIAHPILDFEDVLAARRPMEEIRRAARELSFTPERGVRVRITGNPALNYEEMIDLAWDIGYAGVFCFLLVCAVLYRALRSMRLMISSVATLLVGLVWTAAFAAAAVGQLNILSLSFAVLFIGLGVDFAIHLCMRYTDLRRGGDAHEGALSGAVESVGGSLVICTFTTAVAFFVFLPSDFRGVAELGLIAGVGMFVILFLTVTLLPALLSGWLHVPEGELREVRVHFRGGWLPAVARNARSIRAGAALAALLGVALIIAPGTRFEPNVISMRNRGTESVQAFEDLMELAATSPWYANLLAPDLETADRLAEQLRDHDLVERTITLSDYVPRDQWDKMEILGDVAMILETPRAIPASASTAIAVSAKEQIDALRDLTDFLAEPWAQTGDSSLAASMRLLRGRLLAFLERVDREGNTVEALADLEEVLLSRLPGRIARLRTALEAGPVTIDDLPENLVRRMLAPTGEARVQVFPRENLQEMDALGHFVAAVRRVDPMASGVGVTLVDFGRATVDSFQQALSLAFVLIAVLLFFLWRNAADVGLALAPLVLSAVLTVGVMAAGGIDFNFANVVVLPLLFGVGIDSGIHLVHRSKHALAAGESLLETTTARAVFYSALTTVVSFGTLAFSSHRGVQSLGILLTLGMAITVLCNLVVLPAMLELRTRREARL